MKLVRARVTDFKSIDDSGWVDIDVVTSMVGKNESGKTAFLGALKRLNPVDGDQEFELKDFPRKGYVKYRRRHEDNPATVVEAIMTLSGAESKKVAAQIGEGVILSEEINVSKNYKNELIWDFELDEAAMARHLLDAAELPPEIANHAGNANSVKELLRTLEALDVKPVSVGRLITSIYEQFSERTPKDVVEDILYSMMPKFVYFDEYSTMHGRISIQDMLKRVEAGEDISESDHTFMSLLALVGADLEDLQNQTNYEYMKAELESASISISDEMFEYWAQNKQLRVEFDLSAADPNDLPPLNEGTILHVRIWNNRHRVSVPFDDRSKGFVWFFSFLTYFSSIEEQEECDLVLLLDEPGLNLHALAQNDFLRFIDERLAPKHQVIYTTHSPFMINLNHLDRIRTVQDVDDRGTVISSDTLSNDQDTVFPLQVALGHNLAHTLFLAPHCLMVNSAADMIYLQILGEICASKGYQRLDPRWVVIPVGNADNLPMFVSLLGENYVSVAVLMDVTPKNKEKMDLINKNSIIQRHNPVKWVEVQKIRTADIEDIFEPAFYLNLVNESYAMDLLEPVSMKAISAKDPRIVQRLEAHFESENIAGGHFDSYRPAAWLLENHAQLRHEISEESVERAVSMFQRVNSLLPHVEFASGYAAHHIANGSNGSTQRSNGSNGGGAVGNGRAKAPAFTL
jgi:hypothetical protein